MAVKKGKSLKLHQAINELEEALLQWDGIKTESPKKPRVENDPHKERTLKLLKELKEQLKTFESMPEADRV